MDAKHHHHDMLIKTIQVLVLCTRYQRERRKHAWKGREYSLKARTSKSLPLPWVAMRDHACQDQTRLACRLTLCASAEIGCLRPLLCMYTPFFTLICMVLCRPTTVQSFVLALTSYSYSLYPPHGYAHDWQDWSSRTLTMMVMVMVMVM
jgi:hypothetical protein